MLAPLRPKVRRAAPPRDARRPRVAKHALDEATVQSHRPRNFHQPFQNRLLRRQAISGLVEYHRVRPLEDIFGNLLATVRRQTVQHQMIRMRLRQRLGVELISLKRFEALGVLTLLPHRRPHIGQHDVST